MDSKDELQQDKQRHEHYSGMDGQLECFPACSACCHIFRHQYCASGCATHEIQQTSNDSAALNHISPHASSTNPLSDVTDEMNEHQPSHTKMHRHDILRYRAAYRPPPATRDIGHKPAVASTSPSPSVIGSLSFVDRWLSLWIILVMIIGVIVGYYSLAAPTALNSVDITTVSLPVAFGLWFMMYPVLVKIKYETFGVLFSKRDTFRQLAFSIIANWVH